MKVLCCGGREFGLHDDPVVRGRDQDLIIDSLGQLRLQPLFDLLIEGGASGADRLSGRWADNNLIPHLRVPAPWPQKGKSAGFLRNVRMLHFFDPVLPDLVVAFPGGNGTAHMIRVAREAGVALWQPQQHAELPSQLIDQLRIPQDKV